MPTAPGRFDVRSGAALPAPVCVDLKTWPVEIDHGSIYIDIAAET